MKKLSNAKKSDILKKDYEKWKNKSLQEQGYFPVFSSIKENFILREISGNALKLYIYLGLHVKNNTGECWISIDTMAKYFNKSPRTISTWIKELEDKELIERMQMQKNGVAYTFLRPY